MVGRVRDLVDSLLHPRRRRAAQQRLAGIQPRDVLFICHGNICRSPFAAAVFVRLLPPALSSSINTGSAGFIGPGRMSPPYALNTADTYGIDMSSHRSAVVTSENLQRADLVVVMSSAQAKGLANRVRPGARILILGDLDPLPIKRRTILDPWDSSPAAFEESYGRIDRCVRELVTIISPKQSSN